MDSSVTSKFATRRHWTTDDIRSQIEKSRVTVFSRGGESTPKCGYSAEAIDAVKCCADSYDVVDIKENPSAAAALRAYAGRVSFPAVFVDGHLVSNHEGIDSSSRVQPITTALKGN